MKVLLLGGTGAIGSYLSDILSKNGIDVFITTRCEKLNCDRITYITGNALEEKFTVNLLIEKWDAIVDFMSYDLNAFKSRVDLLLSSTNHYIFLSSSRVYADKKGKIKETTSRLLDVVDDKFYLRTNEYALSKARQENILIQSKYKNWTIIRPYITYGEERLQLGVLEKEEWLYRALNNRTMVFPEDLLLKKTTLTSGYDVSKAISCIVANRDEVSGEIFHITSNISITWGEVLNIYMDELVKHFGHKPKLKLLPTKKFLKAHPAIYQMKYDRQYDRQFDNTKISKYIKVENFTPPEDGLRKCLAEFLLAPKFKSQNRILFYRKNVQTNDYNFKEYIIVKIDDCKRSIVNFKKRIF